MSEIAFEIRGIHYGRHTAFDELSIQGQRTLIAQFQGDFDNTPSVMLLIDSILASLAVVAPRLFAALSFALVLRILSSIIIRLFSSLRFAASSSAAFFGASPPVLRTST